MLKLLERSIASIERRLVLLAPPQAIIPTTFDNVIDDPLHHERLLARMQRFRGSVYVSEGNVKPYQLTPDNRHQTGEDDKSWHLLMTDDDGSVSACLLYRLHDHSVTMQHLERVRHCPLAQSTEWRDKLKGAINTELSRARHEGLGYAELGGWAVPKERRHTPDGLLLALATYGLARMLGGSLMLTTANVAHSCSSILRRLGGSHLEIGDTAIPPYFDPRYNTEIELLRFDSRRPGAKYVGLIDALRQRLSSVAVMANAPAVEAVPAYYAAGLRRQCAA